MANCLVPSIFNSHYSSARFPPEPNPFKTFSSSPEANALCMGQAKALWGGCRISTSSHGEWASAWSPSRLRNACPIDRLASRRWPNMD